MQSSALLPADLLRTLSLSEFLLLSCINEYRETISAPFKYTITVQCDFITALFERLTEHFFVIFSEIVDI